MNALRLAIVPFCVALCAALAAHVAIDVVGDVLLPHDTYDDIAHGSRVFVASGAVAFALVAAFFGLRALLRDACGSEAAFCASLAATMPRRPLAFFAAVFAATPAILAGMEALDAVLAAQRIDDVGDLLGGSLALGLSVTALAALAAAALGWVALRRLACVRPTLVRILASFAGRVRPLVPTVAYAQRVARRVARLRYASITRRAGRAPPRSHAAHAL